MNRRDYLKSIPAVGAATTAIPSILTAANRAKKFKIDYVLSSALYGNLQVSEVVSEIEHCGAVGLSLWRKPYATQREQVEAMGAEEFGKVLKKFNAKLVTSTCYPLQPFGLKAEMALVKKLGGKYLVVGTPSTDQKTLKGKEAKREVLRLIEKMIPHADAAGENGQIIALANRPEQILAHPDAISYFAEFNRHEALGVALCPHFLPEIKKLPELILELGSRNLPYIYFQEDGDGAHHRLQKQVELEQMPGRGILDYTIVAKALSYIEFSGAAEICMHPTPRGLPVLDSAEEITELVNESRIYIDGCVNELA